MIQDLNKAFESRIRLGIMSVLVVNDWVEFKYLKEYLDATDGNLSSHLSSLEKLDYIEVRKEFVGKRPKTSYRVTLVGRSEFEKHLNSLEQLLKNRK